GLTVGGTAPSVLQCLAANAAVCHSNWDQFPAERIAWHPFPPEGPSQTAEGARQRPAANSDRCEFDRRQGRCVPGLCRNGGTCRELSGGGFRCECPAGGYERPYCTVTARSFPPKSFAMFRGLRQRFHLSISLTFATLENSGLLFYNGRFNEKHDFIALEIQEGQVVLKYSTGESSTQVSPFLPGGVSDGNWHTVHIHYYNKPATRYPKRSMSGEAQGPSDEKIAVVSVDDCDTALSLRFGTQLGNYSCAAQGKQTSNKKSLDLTGPLFLGRSSQRT
ncbi:hypothetical protein KUCAC02_012932, partial [Chaenocephalus aceratus]